MIDTSRYLENALELLSAHPTWYIFPIQSLDKAPPLISDNLEQASNDPDQIKKWAKKFPRCNWGLALAKSGLVVIDVDRKAGKIGEQTFVLLDQTHSTVEDDAFPETLKVLSPSGGWHIYYQTTDKVSHACALGKAGFGVDIDSPNYVLIPGCTVCSNPEQPYAVISDAPITSAPEWMADYLKKKAPAQADTAPVVRLDQDSNITWAVDYLKNAAPPSVAGQGGEKTLFDVAGVLKDRGISQEMAVELLNEHYNDPIFGKCDPPWLVGDGSVDDRLDVKVRNAYLYKRQNAPGEETPEAEFGVDPLDAVATEAGLVAQRLKDAEREEKRRGNVDAATAEKKAEKAAKTEKTNLTLEEARLRVTRRWVYIRNCKMFLRRDDTTAMNYLWDEKAFDNSFAYLRGEHSRFSKYLFETTGGKSIAKYDYMTYIPGQDEAVGTTYNLYRPSKVQPVEGDTSEWDAHIAYLFPDEEQRGHLLNWMAWLLQNLDKKPMHALLLAGYTTGTGKTFVAKVLAKILGEHNVAEIKEGELESQFTEWARKTKLLVIEELQSVERNKVRMALHNLITETTTLINDKNVKRYKLDTCFGVMAMTNEEAAIQIKDNDRRYLVLRTKAVKQDTEYGARLYDLLRDESFLSAVYFQLLTRKLGSYRGNGDAPMTDAKRQMIDMGLSDLEHYLLDHKYEWPLCNPVVCIEDIKNGLPPSMVKGNNSTRLYASIATVLKQKFQAIQLAQVRLKDGSRRRLWAVNGSAIGTMPDANPAATYERCLRGQPVPSEAGQDFAEDAE